MVMPAVVQPHPHSRTESRLPNIDRMAAALAMCIVAATTALRLRWLLAWPFPIGRDGYYYVLQVRSLLAHGVPYYPTAFQWPLWFMAGCSWLTRDSVVGIKAAIAAAFAGVLICAFLLVREITGLAALGLVSVALLVASPLRDYFLAEFSANLVAIAATTVAVWLVAKAEHRPTRGRIAAAAVTTAAAAASHPSALIVLAIILPSDWVLRRFRKVRSLRRSQMLDLVLAVSTVIAIGILCLPNASTWLTVEFKLVPVPTLLPYSFWPEALILLLTCAVLLVRCRRIDENATIVGQHRQLLLGIVVAVGFTALNPWARYDTGLTGTMERLGLWSWLFVAILVPAALVSLDYRGRQGAVAVGLIVCAALAALVPRSATGATDPYLADRMALKSDLSLLRRSVPDNSLVVAEHGTEFMVTAETGLRAESHPSSGGAISPMRYWLIRTVGLRTADLPRKNAVFLSQWAAIREDELFRWLAKLSRDQRRTLAVQNRLLIGPLSLRWRKAG